MKAPVPRDCAPSPVDLRYRALRVAPAIDGIDPARAEPALRRLGCGKAATLDVEAVEQLSTPCVDHAGFEEAAMLPLADRMPKIGGRSALALGFAMRRNPYRANGCI